MHESSIQSRQVKLKYAFQTSGPFHLDYIATGHILTALMTINWGQEAENCPMESYLLDINMLICLLYVSSTPLDIPVPLRNGMDNPGA